VLVKLDTKVVPGRTAVVVIRLVTGTSEVTTPGGEDIYEHLDC